MIVYSVSSLRAINPDQFKMISFQHVTPGSVWHQGGTFFSVKNVSAIYFPNVSTSIQESSVEPSQLN